MGKLKILSKIIEIQPPKGVERILLHMIGDKNCLVEFWIGSKLGNPDRYIITNDKVIEGIFATLKATSSGEIKYIEMSEYQIMERINEWINSENFLKAIIENDIDLLLNSTINVTIKYDWKQAKSSIPNMPIFLVENVLDIKGASECFMRIEHLVTKDIWIIELMGYYKSTEPGKILESDRIKKLAESRMAILIGLLNEIKK